MKQTILLLIIIALSGFNMFAQGYIKVYSNRPEASSEFIVYLNGEAQDAYPASETEIEGLLPGKYNLTVSFDADTIADCVKSFKMKKNDRFVFRVEKLSQFSKDAKQLGRNMKKDAKGDDGLVQYYKLVREKVEKK